MFESSSIYHASKYSHIMHVPEGTTSVAR